MKSEKKYFFVFISSRIQKEREWTLLTVKKKNVKWKKNKKHFLWRITVGTGKRLRIWGGCILERFKERKKKEREMNWMSNQWEGGAN